MVGFRVLAGEAAKGGGGPPRRYDAAVVVVHGPNLGRMIPVADTLSIGRAETCDVRVDTEGVSESHAELVRDERGVTIFDAGRGTLVNEAHVQEARLGDGDVIRIGRGALLFLCGGDVRRKYEEEIRRLSMVDPLTRAFNRRTFAKVLEHELDRSRRHDRPASLLMAGIDDFARYNELHGRIAGDDLLCNVARVAGGTARHGAVVARHESDVFLVILPSTRLEQAIAVGETLRLKVARTLPRTLSVGVATWDAVMSADGLVSLAQERLQSAKDAGRNCVAGR